MKGKSFYKQPSANVTRILFLQNTGKYLYNYMYCTGIGYLGVIGKFIPLAKLEICVGLGESQL
jgi:hypothetical protein